MSSFTWIRTAKRHRIYARDTFRCVWCDRAVIVGLKSRANTHNALAAHLDHVVPRSEGGSNKASNLVTACHSCNSNRQNMPAERFAVWLAAFMGANRDEYMHVAFETIGRVCRAMGRKLPE